MYDLKTFRWKNTNSNLKKKVKIRDNTYQGYIKEYFLTAIGRSRTVV